MNEQEAAKEQADELESPGTPESVSAEAGQEAAAPPEPTAMALLEQRLEEATKAAAQDRDRFMRAHAEMENLRRRAEKDVQNAHKYALERFAKELLAVVDSLELGLQAAETDTAGADALREGMQLTLKQLLAVLERFEIRPIDPLGERFNPELHQAMAMEATAELEPNSVLRVFQKGYLLHERLLRPAMVVVSQALPTEPGGVDEES